MSAQRKKPFSAKQKKAQIQEKRAKKKNDLWDWDKSGDQEGVARGTDDAVVDDAGGGEVTENVASVTSAESRPSRGRRGQEVTANGGVAGSARLESVFAKLPPDVIEAKKRESMRPLVRLPKEALEVGFEEVYSDFKTIDMPKRPPWTLGESKETLESREEQYFKSWIDNVYAKHPANELSYFEHNLEVWRQLWRVSELSDIMLLVVDSRHPILHFPPSLFDHIVKELGKKLVLVFNKIDLIDAVTLQAWKSYFVQRFPGLLTATFSCYPKEGFLQTDSAKEALKSRQRRRYKRYVRAVGISDVLSACRDVHLVKDGVSVDWDSLISKTEKELQERYAADQAKQQRKEKDDEFLGRSRRRQKMPSFDDSGADESEHEHTSDEDDDGKDETPAVVELEPGKITKRHTKHFQTIHLTPEVRLCDCPGLVFPAIIPKPVQILSGMYRIAQVQEPYTAIQYLAERVPLEEILRLRHPDQEDDDDDDVAPWSAWKMCEAYAIQRGFLTGRAARPDVYRAANAILQLVNDGRIILSFKPPGYFQLKHA
ncbi:Guanine nucleotide-binding-like protein 1 [Rhizophlyctis rosea]|nr:Guanine nucleotide-binding-like protein 1 [Rhizophlyctis rosea]